MNELTYLQVLELNNRKQKSVSLGKLYEQEGVLYDINEFTDYERIFIEFGKFCEHYTLDSDDYFNYETYLECGSWDWNIDDLEFNSINENKLYTFTRRLKTGEYKCILYNESIPILGDDLDIWENFFLQNFQDSIVEVGYDTLKIIKDKETIFLEGLEEISDLEIQARKFLEECDDELIVKDNEFQVEMREDNYKKTKDYYDKCKDILKIEDFLIYDKKSFIYRNNWDCLWIYYKGKDNPELWQRP